MKPNRILVFILILLLLPMLFAYSEVSDIPVEKKDILNRDILNSFIIADSQADKSILDTDDVVVVHDDGTISVTTSGITMNLLPPFGWITLTQDVMAQLDLYMSLTDDIEGLVNELKNMKAHIYSLDLLTGSSAVFLVEQDSLSKLFADINSIPEDDLELVIKALNIAYGADDMTLVELGGNKFFRLKYASSPDTLIYSTFVNHQTIDIYCYSGEEELTDFDVEAFELMLTDLVISAE